MEDVEDEASENTKQSQMIEAMRKAQGIEAEEVDKMKTVKVKVDDGW